MVVKEILYFQSTCPARGTTDGRVYQSTRVGLSIHVPREGHDFGQIASAGLLVHFQSTCPARGTTRNGHYHAAAHSAISIHVPREGHD